MVSERLVTFKNIEELQMQNQRLLAVVRELTESQEKATRDAHENQLQLIRVSIIPIPLGSLDYENQID